MCILFIYTNPSPPKGGYRLIIASNRDEFYSRPSKLAYKCHETNIIGGRDMTIGREGGMWLGITTNQSTLRFAALLNVTGETKITKDVVGRGPIVYNYLADHTDATDYIKFLQTKKYNAFNVVLLEMSGNNVKAYHHSNSPDKTYKYEGAQILAFGNSTPAAPLTKVKEGKMEFEDIIEKSQNRDDLKKRLVEFLKSRQKHLPDPELQRRAPDNFAELSSVYVQIENAYGTRVHSIILVDDQGAVEFLEYSMKSLEDINWDFTQINSHL